MHRLVAILILILLPVQWTFAAVGSYCRHEAAVAAKSHVGHHEHEHEHAKPVKADGKGDSGTFEDQDCPTCHYSFVYGVSAIEMASLPDVATAPILFRSHLIPDRSPDNPFRPPHTAGA